jgi:CheY-like chemotaxis protein
LRILLAEDNPVNQKLAVSLLEKQGHTVVVVNNGREVLEQLQMEGQSAICNLQSAIPFDLVLMDVQMPDMDGLQTTAEIRRRETRSGRHVPIIAMTAYAMRGDRERCLAAGMDGYLSKPIQRAELRQAIEAAVPAGAAGPEPEAGRDWSGALAGVQGDRELLQELAGLFLEECPRWLAEIQAALAEGDCCRLQRAAHTLKGSVQVFTAQAASQAAFLLEDMARRKDLSQAGEAWAALAQEMDRLRPALAALARPARCPATA